MTTKTEREQAWEDYESLLRASVAYSFARWTCNLTYDALPPEVVHVAKRTLLDTFAAAIGAYPAAGRVALEGMADEIGGKAQATVIGSGKRTSASNAMLINCFLVRQLDYNDLRGGGHNSDSISPLLAVAEAEGSSGRDLITSLVVSYEISERYVESVTIPAAANSKRLWNHWQSDGTSSSDVASGENKDTVAFNSESRAGFCMPTAIGKLMGLTEDQIANAIGIGALHSNALKISDADNEDLRMVRNIRFGIPAHTSYLGCLMAKHGFTGIIRIVEGAGGIRDTLLHGFMDLDRLVDFNGWRILGKPGTGNKTVCQNGATHGIILATLHLVKEHDLKPEDIESVNLRTSVSNLRHTTFSPAKKYPRNEESASHSSYFSNAIAIKERAVGPLQLKPGKFDDPVVLGLIDKITVVGDPSLTRWAGISEIRTKDGRMLQHRVDVPDGFNDTLSDEDIEEKYRDAAAPYISKDRIERLISAVWDLDKAKGITDLMQLLVVDAR